MPKLPPVKPYEIIRILESIGFYKIRQKGSHLQMKRGNLLVTIPIHPGDLSTGTLRSILRQARLDIDEFLKLF
ncbi:MAG: type II toxin-antitoxin system HicA family toxin [Nitrospirota bacterium]